MILRHRSVAVLLRRGHLEDARLLLRAFVDELRSTGRSLGNEDVAAEAIQWEEQIPASIAPGSLDPAALRALQSVNKRCHAALRRLVRQADLSKKTGRAPFGIAVVFVAVVILLIGGQWYFKHRKIVATEQTLDFLSQVSYIAKIKTGRTLIDLTRSNCSECPCLDKQDHRGEPVGRICLLNWVHALSAIWEAASGEEATDVQGRLRLEKRFIRDPWGTPYALNENEGEGEGCDSDILRSAGPDGIFETADDIKSPVPTLCPKP